MIAPSYMPFLRLIYNLLLLGTCIIILALFALKFLGQDYNAQEYYKKLKEIIHKYSTLRFTAICLMLALGFASHFAFTELQGSSMEPNFLEGQLALIKYHSYKLKRGDLVIIQLDEETNIFKRLIGLPGDRIEISAAGDIMVNWKPLDESSYLDKRIENTLEIEMIMPKDQVFVLGDNRKDSYDSREHGGFKKNKVLGKVIFNLGTPPKWIMKLWRSL